MVPSNSIPLELRATALLDEKENMLAWRVSFLLINVVTSKNQTPLGISEPAYFYQKETLLGRHCDARNLQVCKEKEELSLDAGKLGS